MPEIKALWQQLFGSAPTTHNRQFLERRLAYRLQEEAFRKVDPGLLERNRRRIDTLVETGKNQRRDRDYRPVAGTVLTREYRDVVYRVIATADGAVRLRGPHVPQPLDDRPRDHRHPVVGAAVLRAQGARRREEAGQEEGGPAMSEVLKRRLRCAVYTRKSTDEGLDQEYNSIDAQRDAGHAYIASQRAEGWIPVADDYDDPAYSGGNMERPALKRLLADIEAGKVDVVVIYKIDRLTRSLADFSKMVEVFERYGVSFVSITQQFNTTTSMGRLMLNILLSFAQFEREVTGERIRDKIAASKRKGMWMGGVPPLGLRRRRTAAWSRTPPRPSWFATSSGASWSLAPARPWSRSSSSTGRPPRPGRPRTAGSARASRSTRPSSTSCSTTAPTSGNCATRSSGTRGSTPP